MDTVKKEQVRLERTWNDSLLADDPTWRRLCFTSREYLHPDQDLVLWQYVEGQPKVLELLTVCRFGLSPEEGPTMGLRWARGEILEWVSTTPHQIAPGVYIWIPAFAGIRYTPTNFKDPHSPRRLSVPLCIRTLYAPHKPAERAMFLTPLAQFRRSYPHLG